MSCVLSLGSELALYRRVQKVLLSGQRTLAFDPFKMRELLYITQTSLPQSLLVLQLVYQGAFTRIKSF